MKKMKFLCIMKTTSGVVTAFVVKLLSVIDGKEVEILRYDSGHGIPHIDVLDVDGETKHKIWLYHLDNAKAFTQAKKDIEQNYIIYKERYLQWKEEKKIK